MRKNRKKLSGNISTLTKDQFLENTTKFALFLRGFEDDDYSKEKDLVKSKDIDKFSEYKFINLLETKIPTCAVGMTKETDSPYGAKRVYVDDDSWQSDVAELMTKAENIYILVNNRESCIWEIEQTANIQNKTIYIVNEIDKYNEVRKALENKIDLPIIPSELLVSGKHYFITTNNGERKISVYENNRDGYASILNIDITPILTEELEEKKRKKGCRRTIWIVFAIAMLSLIAWALIDSFSSDKKELEKIVRTLNESETGSVSELMNLEKLEYDGRAVTMTYSVADEVIIFDGVRANEEIFRNNMLIGYANNTNEGFKKFLEAIVKAEADLIILINCEGQEPITIRFTAKELKNNLASEDVDAVVRLKAAANNAKLQTPMVVDDGLIMTDVFLDSYYFIYVYDCDESKYDIDYMEENVSEIKEEIMEYVLSDDSTIKAIRGVLKEAHYGLAYKYIGSTSGKTYTIYIEPEELQ